MAKGLTGVILAGGASRRTGCDKPFLETDGRPLIKAALASTLYNQVDGMVKGHGIVNTRGVSLQTNVEGHSYEIMGAIDSLAPLFVRPCHGVPWTDHNLLILAGGALALATKGGAILDKYCNR